jgi:hypothetical protein
MSNNMLTSIRDQMLTWRSKAIDLIDLEKVTMRQDTKVSSIIKSTIFNTILLIQGKNMVALDILREILIIGHQTQAKEEEVSDLQETETMEIDQIDQRDQRDKTDHRSNAMSANSLVTCQEIVLKEVARTFASFVKWRVISLKIVQMLERIDEMTQEENRIRARRLIMMAILSVKEILRAHGARTKDNGLTCTLHQTMIRTWTQEMSESI